MPPFYIIFLSFMAGAGITFFCIRGGPSLKHIRTVNQLKADKANLTNDNANLEDRNVNLSKTVRRIENLEREVKQIKSQVNTNIELLTSVTSIRDKIGKDSRIIIGDGFKKKYGLNSKDHSQNLSDNDTYISE